MVLDVELYRINRKFIHSYYEDHKDEDINRMISSLSVSTMVPCICVAYYVGEVSGWPEEVIETIKRLTKFCGYSKIINVPDGCPV
jgi:hypothetical protein